MSVIAHLSDLHLGSDERLQHPLLDGLVTAMGGLRERVDLLLLTGDVFDTAEPEPARIEEFAALLSRFEDALGGAVPTLLLPGNHDRRHAGAFAPWSGALFRRLQEHLAARPNVQVLGNDVPFLARLVDVPELGADLVAYDSTWLPRGLLSAGGLVRQEDLLRVAATLGERPANRPLIFALHHHLVPTPVTDTSLIDTTGRPLWQRFLVDRLIPELVASGEREEVTMTALGAGTALSTLHQLGRAVLVLHGHKHYPTARLLKGVSAHEGDVLVTSAGSCGTATAYGNAEFDEAPRLWPSFNLVHLEPQGLRLEMVSWSPWTPGRANAPRPMLLALRRGARWRLKHGASEPLAFEPLLAENSAECALLPSRASLDRYDVSVRRRVRAMPSAASYQYWELVPGAPGSRVVDLRCNEVDLASAMTPARVPLPCDGEASYRIEAGAVASVDAACDAYGPGTAYEWVGLLNRTRSAEASLSLDLGPVESEPFASATDLSTGQERPLPLHRTGRTVRAECRPCDARCLLRIYWPLLSSTSRDPA